MMETSEKKRETSLKGLQLVKCTITVIIKINHIVLNYNTFNTIGTPESTGTYVSKETDPYAKE